ncbi:MAG: NAD(P)-dependent oxidoreductase [Bacteroidetes bacterium]|nr:NAD(P)-dependent oxidoreductase [Bacteroidota bacterium]
MKAFLGMGLLGSNFVKAMLQRGETVRVWNRTAAKAMLLEKEGALVFEHARDAVRGATEIHLTLKDDVSVNEVLEAAGEGLMPGAVIIDHTTTSMEGAIERTKWWKKKGYIYQHAPVFMGPANALTSTGFMLVSGDPEVISMLEPTLSQMTGHLLNFGPEAGKAAAIKLAGNSFLISFVFAVREMLSVSKVLGLHPDELDQLFSSWNPCTGMRDRMKKMLSGDYSNPSWELAMARKDMQLFLDAAKQENAELLLMPSMAALADQWIGKGFGNYDWTVIGKDLV